MSEALGNELIHVRCGSCGQVPSFSLESLEHNNHPFCPFCHATLNVDLQKAEKSARREAQELDDAIDALGSEE